MIEDRLNGLAHLYINRYIELARLLNSLERVTDAWRLYEPIRNIRLEVAALLIVLHLLHDVHNFTLQ
jgi:hypothetical protein